MLIETLRKRLDGKYLNLHDTKNDSAADAFVSALPRGKPLTTAMTEIRSKVVEKRDDRFAIKEAKQDD